MARKQAKRPRKFGLGRTAWFTGDRAECHADGDMDRWAEVPQALFEARDAARMRRLADWLRAAADWVEAKP